MNQLPVPQQQNRCGGKALAHGRYAEWQSAIVGGDSLAAEGDAIGKAWSFAAFLHRGEVCFQQSRRVGFLFAFLQFALIFLRE